MATDPVTRKTAAQVVVANIVVLFDEAITRSYAPADVIGTGWSGDC